MASGVILSASVRQNLLSLQSTSDLLATTQGRLASGKRVNSALDNPVNFFTASGLDQRASDINNLLDSIGNGVQVLQAANTGITSLQKLVDTAKSIANQALQSTVGFSTKANITSAAITANGAGVTASDLRGLGTVINTAVAPGAVVNLGAATGTLAANSLLSAIGNGAGGALGNTLSNGDSFTVNGKTISFDTNTVTATKSVTDAFGNVTFFVQSGAQVQDLLNAIDVDAGNASFVGGAITALPGGVLSSVAGSGTATSKLQLNTGVNSDLTLGGTTGLTKLGLVAGTTARTGDTLTFAATPGGQPTVITFGNGTAGSVQTLSQLNAILAGDNLTASLDLTGKLTIATSNDTASFVLPAVGGTAQSGTDTNGAFQTAKGAVTTTNPIADPTSQAARQGLVTQYNQVLNQIATTAKDASFNGVNLLNGDTLKLVFNETATSTINITGVNFGPGGLGLANLVAGTDFVDNNATNRVLTALNTSGTILRSEASALGANLSVVQIRQDFSKNLINVLQTGSSNLTLADTNEEAANNQALSTRQQIAVSTLALANTAQQSVLRLLQ
jgi:flagellin-like hook-associated protein FlgL